MLQSISSDDQYKINNYIFSKKDSRTKKVCFTRNIKKNSEFEDDFSWKKLFPSNLFCNSKQKFFYKNIDEIINKVMSIENMLHVLFEYQTIEHIALLQSEKNNLEKIQNNNNFLPQIY